MNTTGAGTLSELLATATSLCPWTLLSPISSWKAYVAPTALGYMLLCRALRYRGEKSLRRDMGFPASAGREALSHMTNDEAQQIIKYLASWEFPLFHFLSLQFGLFKAGPVPLFSFSLCLWALATGSSIRRRGRDGG
jgi:hypothetical protein